MPHRNPRDNPPLRAVFLGSGSSGNATAVTDGTTTLLVDCGFSARECARRLESAGIPAAGIAAVLLTHEHRDHVCGVDVFARHRGTPVFATAGTLGASRLESRLHDLRAVRPQIPVRIGTLEVTPFRTSHDAVEPVGFLFESQGGTRLGIATDTGVLTDETACALAGCDLIGIECNHDPEMLDTGPYPYFLKERIRSARGHLSNADAADAIAGVASPRLRAVFALHVSRTNNTADLAGRALAERLESAGIGAPVKVARQDEACFSEAAAP